MSEPEFATAPRPRCTICEEEMVHAAIVVLGHVYYVWICNCEEQPQGIVEAIVNTRLEWDQAALIITENLFEEIAQ
jgi:hypothetical protein